MSVSLSYATALALIFAGAAGAATTITNPVTGQNQIVNDNDTEYTITSSGYQNAGIFATNTDITIGGDNTQSITVKSEQYIGVISYGNNDESSVTLEAAQNNEVEGNTSGQPNYGSGINASAIGDATSAVTLIAGQDNVVTGYTSSTGSDTYGHGINAYAYVSAGNNSSATSTVWLEAGQNNYVENGWYGIRAEANASDAGSAKSTVELTAGQDNYVEGGGDSGIRAWTNGSGESTSAVTLTAGLDNYVESGGNYGIMADAYGSGESTSTVTLYAGQDNYVGGNSGIYARAGTNTSNYANATSAVTLEAGRNNVVVTGGDYGIYAYAAASSEDGAESKAISTVTLTAGQDNVVTGSNYGIYAYTGTGDSTNAEVESKVALTATNGKNIITATDKEDGTAIYAYVSTVELTGATELNAATGASATSGGTITFDGTVTTDAATAAASSGSGSTITFNDGLVTTSASTLTATGGGVIYVYDNSGNTSYIGTTDTAGGTGTIGMTLASGSAWYLTGNSSATMLTLNSGGLLDMTADSGAFSTLTLTNLYGDDDGNGGIISMDIDASTNENNSDRIYITGTHDGTHYISLNNVVSDTDGADGTVLVSVADEQGSFNAVDNEVEDSLYYYGYALKSQESATYESGTDWYLSRGIVYDEDGQPKETTTVSTVTSAVSLGYHNWMIQNTKLLQRLGDLRQSLPENDKGAWFRVSGTKLSQGGSYAFQSKYTSYELGYDQMVEQNSQYRLYGGIFFNYTNGDSYYRRGKGDNESKSMGLYRTQINEGGSYFDLVLRAGAWDNDFTVYDTNGTTISGGTESIGVTLSAEVGKKMALNNRGFYIEPQAQLTYGHLRGGNFKTNTGVQIDSESIDSLVGRVGFNLGWDVNKRTNLYLKANLMHEFLGDYGVTLRDGNDRVYRSGDFSDTWFVYGLGAAFRLNQNGNGNYLYFDVERSTGGDIDQEWFYNVGLRFDL